MEDEPQQLTLEPPAQGAPEVEPPPALEAELAAEREARIRAEAEANALRSVARPAPQAPPVPTVESIEAAFQAGRIDAETRQGLLDDLRLDQKLEQREATRRRSEAERTARDRLAAYTHKYPDLRRADSELIGRVHAEIQTLSERLDVSPDDLRVHLMAVEQICGPLSSESPPARIPIRERPVPRSFAGGSFNPTPPKEPEKSPGEKLFEALTGDAQDFMLRLRGSREAAIKTLQHATPENVEKLRRQGRFK